ncbi:hypothetical protein ABZ642_34855 [Streptomyces sp. NPDC007157]|uniref:hypothetical protein n=1 Tax=Streptomyces sp. NPDC007157 TaxID=3154681 RepID=UPI0033CD4B63
MLTSRPDHLDEEPIFLKHLLERCPELTTLYNRVRSFADIFVKKRSDLLARWIPQVVPASPNSTKLSATGHGWTL